jgi:hypothetical protein
MLHNLPTETTIVALKDGRDSEFLFEQRNEQNLLKCTMGKKRMIFEMQNYFRQKNDANSSCYINSVDRMTHVSGVTFRNGHVEIVRHIMEFLFS